MSWCREGQWVGMILLMPVAYALTDDDAEYGIVLYESRRGGCHLLDVNRIGALRHGVFGPYDRVAIIALVKQKS